jgi:hypothetical protein
VRIPEQKAKELADDGGEPGILNHAVWQRAANVATKAGGILDPLLAITVTSEVDSEMPPDLPKTPNFQDEDGAEGWVL